MKRISILVLIFCACFVSVAWGQQPAAKGQNNWTEFRRTNMMRWNPYENVLNVNNVGRLHRKGSHATGNIVASSPAVANGAVYISAGNTLYALDADTGALLWSYPAGGGSPAVANGVVYVAGGQYYGNTLYALDASAGALLWSYFTYSYQDLSSPALANGVVYLGTAAGCQNPPTNYLYALDASTGALLWSYHSKGKLRSSPSIVNGMVYIGTGGHNVFAFGLKKGRQ